MKKKFGKDWYKHHLPRDIYDRWHEKSNNDKSLAYR